MKKAIKLLENHPLTKKKGAILVSSKSIEDNK